MKILRRISLSVISVLFAIISLTTTTFAWFTVTTINYVDGFEMHVSSTDLIEISLDGENYYYSITNDMILKALGKDSIVFDNVTTTDQNVFTTLDKKVVERNTSYLSLTLWFRTKEMSDTALYLENNVSNSYSYDYVYEQVVNGTFVISKGITLINDFTYNDGSDVLVMKGETKKYYADEAIRIGIQELNVDSPNLLQPDLRTTNELKSFIFDPSEKEERGFGKTYGAYDYYKQKGGRELELPEVFPNTIYQLSGFLNPYVALDNVSQVATYQEGIDETGISYFYAKIQVNIWLEGWDADCMDNIMYDDILMQLSFTGANPA